MSVFLTVALAAATQFQPTCSWDRPGANPYTGSTSAAIERYTDIPEQVRRTLKRRMDEHLSDDRVSITRDAIVGKNQYEPAIRDMHFGAASVCATVTRSKWSENRQEPGAVYCVGEYCILVPRICGNISRITRLPAPHAAGTGAAPAAPASAQRDLGDRINARDLGLADAPRPKAPILTTRPARRAIVPAATSPKYSKQYSRPKTPTRPWPTAMTTITTASLAAARAGPRTTMASMTTTSRPAPCRKPTAGPCCWPDWACWACSCAAVASNSGTPASRSCLPRRL